MEIVRQHPHYRADDELVNPRDPHTVLVIEGVRHFDMALKQFLYDVEFHTPGQIFCTTMPENIIDNYRLKELH